MLRGVGATLGLCCLLLTLAVRDALLPTVAPAAFPVPAFVVWPFVDFFFVVALAF